MPRIHRTAAYSFQPTANTSMYIRYSEWTDNSLTSDEKLEQLFRLFSFLLTKTSGDVDEALDWMSRLDEQYNILGDMTMEQFIDELKKAGLIRDGEEGGVDTFDLTAKGAQR